MTRRETIGGAALTAYFLATTLGHLRVSQWLVRVRQSELLGTFQFADFLPHAGLALLLAVAIWQAWRAWRGRNRAATVALWAGCLVLVWAAGRWLIFSVPEYIHYPQYAVLAFGMAWLADPDRARHAVAPILLACTALGIADETLQYTWITVSHSDYLDFNDFLLNLLGALAGLLLYYGFTRSQKADPRETRSNKRYGLTGFPLLGLAMAAAILMVHRPAEPDHPGPLERKPRYGHWIPSPHTGHYYVLTPWNGTLALVSLGALATVMTPGRRQSRQRRSQGHP